ncbi:Adaptin N terminal region family protein [Tritrichomonas foetus]|uniref:Adaptin N terminal region family protein n=1 Tax=Tritrichomonas foetus TaxID=1144522 RepID=A0A1J4JSQ2_9EUKA|nr:Adaptin N terminal region family protein [Tritrichomonas foetus]|eukprot:OHT00532.1 Adaptin N terminal region family protein [Tritrichomonas foetus]
MTSLGSYGSKDFEVKSNDKLTESSQQASSGAPAILSPENQSAATLEQISKLIISSNAADRTKAIKMLICLMSKGRDFPEYAPLVVQLCTSTDPLCRQLACIFLNHYSEECSDTILLSINTFQKSLMDNDPIVRAMSLKMISSVQQTDIIPEIHNAVEQIIGDSSPYVKKEAAFAIIKAAELDPNLIESYLVFIERLMKETDPIAFSGAITAYWMICPENIEFIHPNFRFICQNMHKFDEYAQVYTIRAMTVYTRLCFKDPSIEKMDESENAFWEENPEKETSISPDHLLLISSVKKLLNSPNAAVVMAAVSYIFYCAPSSHINSLSKPLVRLMYENQTVCLFALKTILTIAKKYPHIFVPYLNHFYVRKNDSSPVKKLKLKLLSTLASPSNAEMILNEFTKCTGSIDTEFASLAVKTMGKTAMSNRQIIPTVLISLLRLMGRAEGPVLSDVVIVVSSILRLKRGTDDESQALKHLCKKFVVIKDPSARAAVLSIVGDMHETHPEYAPQLVRYVAQNLSTEPAEVKLQALTLSAKLLVSQASNPTNNPENEENDESKVESNGKNGGVPLYLLKLCARDTTEFDVRDRARLLVALVESSNEKVKPRMKELLFSSTSSESTKDNTGKPELQGKEQELYQIGTFSHFYGREVSGYEPLIDWAPEEELPNNSVRIPIKKFTGNGASNEENENDEIGVEGFFSDGYVYEEEEEEEEGGNVVNAVANNLPNNANNDEEDEVEYYEYEEDGEENFFD